MNISVPVKITEAMSAFWQRYPKAEMKVDYSHAIFQNLKCLKLMWISFLKHKVQILS